MKLKIENFGRIYQADLDLGQISIIAGKNDTGKSSISKLIFSLVYGLSEEGRIKTSTLYKRKKIDKLAFELYKKTENHDYRKMVLVQQLLKHKVVSLLSYT